MASAPIPIARQNGSADDDDHHRDRDSSSSDLDSDIDQISCWGSQWGASNGLPIDGGISTAGTMAYSLIDAQSLQRHQEMLSRAAGRHRGLRADFSKAQSLPSPRAPFLSSIRKDHESMKGLPPMSLPESAVLDDTDETTGQSVPSTYGSLRNSTLSGLYYRTNQLRSKSSQFSSLEDVSANGAYSLPTIMGRSRTRIRQRPDADAEEQKQVMMHGQKNVTQYGEHVAQDNLNTIQPGKDKNYLEKDDYFDLDLDDEPVARKRNHQSLLGTSLTALGVMEFSRPHEENHALKFTGSHSVRFAESHSVTFADSRQSWEIDKMQMKYNDAETSLENKERDYCFDFDEDVDMDNNLPSPQNPDVEEAFDLDL